MTNNTILFNDTMSTNDFYSLTRTEMVAILKDSNEEAYYSGMQQGIRYGYWNGIIISLLFFVAAVVLYKSTIGKKFKDAIRK